jgi:hypothetical protein
VKRFRHDKSSGLVSQICPRAHMRCWKRRGVKLSVQAQGHLGHREATGEGKAGRANSREPLVNVSSYRTCRWFVFGREWPALRGADGIRRKQRRLWDTVGHGTEGAPTPAATSACGTREPCWGPESTGKPTARKAQVPSWNRMAQEANAGRPKGQGKTEGRPTSRAPGHNPPDTGPGDPARKGADVGQVSL